MRHQAAPGPVSRVTVGESGVGVADGRDDAPLPEFCGERRRAGPFGREAPARDVPGPGEDFQVFLRSGVAQVAGVLCPGLFRGEERPFQVHAAECGAVLAHFHGLLSDLDISRLHDPLPGFHITPRYLAKYDETVQSDAGQRRLSASMEARRLAQIIEDRRAFVPVLQDAVASGELKMRVMHGDPKINNIMIDDYTGKGTAMIDLDTVSPGLVQYDFGDAVRSICNPAGEEELNLNHVVFDMDLFEAFSKGYLAQAKTFLTDADRHYLYAAARLITFELGLRFFQDYLAGSVYFKTRSAEQNLHRARVQFRLCESIESRERMIKQVLGSHG